MIKRHKRRARRDHPAFKYRRILSGLRDRQMHIRIATWVALGVAAIQQFDRQVAKFLWLAHRQGQITADTLQLIKPAQHRDLG
jgi:hypothetical protein